MTLRHQLSPEVKGQTVERLKHLLSQRKEVQFVCLHGSFLEPDRGFRDIDIAVWAEPSQVSRQCSLEYEWKLSSWLEHQVQYPIDVKVLNYAPIGFRHAVSGGILLVAKDEVLWYNFREQTWKEYLDFAPLVREMLFDLLDAR
jgi:predicted nucleotidyltransferase